MVERDFWMSLEFRISREFARLPDRRYRFFWCDGFVPRDYLLDDATPRIVGTVWICDGPAQEEWQFALLLPSPSSTLEDLDWAALLPPDGTTGWMSFDAEHRCLEIQPSLAVPEPG